MAYGGRPPVVPRGFTDLQTAWNQPLAKPKDKFTCDMIGVCVDVLPLTKSKGTDWTMKVTLHDPYWASGPGMVFQLFFRDEALAVPIHQGDVVIFRAAGTYFHEKLGKVAWSQFSSTLAVLEYQSLCDTEIEDFNKFKTHRSRKDGRLAPAPNVEQIKYAKDILALEDQSSWQTPAKATSLQINSIKAANGGTASVTPPKFKLISELATPSDKYTYVDMVVEVRRVYTTDLRMELSVTDYTENPVLYDYKPESENGTGYDHGDQYGYASSSHKSWPGPWGRRTFGVTLWEPHRSWAVTNIQHGSLINLRNVHIKLDSADSKLEGVCHTDTRFPEKLLVSTMRPYEAEQNPQLRNLLSCKKTYEDACKSSGLRFIRDADPNKIQSSKTNGTSGLPQLEEQPRNAKATKNRRNKKKTRAKAAATTSKKTNAGGAVDSADATSKDTETQPSLAPNAHVRIVQNNQSSIRISDILDPKTRLQTTFEGNTWTAPFVNRRYKSKVRVVDFFPDRLEDFVVRVKQSQYAAAGLGDDDDEEILDASGDSSDGNNSDAMSLDNDGDADNTKRAKWEWRFALIVTDADQPSKTTSSTERPQMTLIVSGAAAEYLLRDSACNLRKKPGALNALREKMCVLWGDLEELKSEAWTAIEANGTEIYDEEAVKSAMEKVQTQYRSKPFECFIEEYGVLKERGLQENKAEDWERCFQMVRTTIA